MAAAALLSPTAAGAEDHARLQAKLRAAMRQANAASGAYVYDLDDRARLFARKAGTPRILASNTKLFTTSAVLDRFGADATFKTTVLADRRGNLYLHGGGDPTFGSESFAERAYGGGGATLAKLVRKVKAAGIKRVTGRVFGDESLFDSLRGGPDSGYGVSVWVGPLSALSFNRGLARENGSAFQQNPPAFAAAKLSAALGRAGIQVGGKPGVRAAPANARRVASASSIPLARIVRITNHISDNFFAEMLAKQLDARPGHPGTTRGGSRDAARFAEREFGTSAHLVDGSGLDRGNRASPRGIVRLLQGMHDHDEHRAFYRSLAVPGAYGTLEDRKTNHRCRAKTGTISGVSALSGYCRAVSGDLIAFSFLMNGVGYDYDRARRIQDAMTQIVAKYG